jgi:hypothetical protein
MPFAVPLPFRWPPKGSPGGRGRCLGGASAVSVAPEGVAGLAGAVPLPSGWPPKGSPVGLGRCRLPLPWPPRGSRRGRGGCRCLSSGPRGGRCLGGGVGPGVPFGGGWCVPGAPVVAPKSDRGAPVCAVVRSGGAGGAPKSSVVLRSAPWCRAGCRWGSEELRGTPVGADASKPRGASSPPSEEGGSSVPWSGLPRPRGGLGRRAVGGPPVRFRGSAVGVLGVRGWRGCLSEERRRCRLRPWVRPPEGGWAHFGPRWRLGRLGQAPSGPSAAGLRPSEEGRARASRKCLLLAGKSSWLPRRGGAVRVRVCSDEAEASLGRPRGPRRLCWGRSSRVGVCGRPLRGRSVPRGGRAARVRLMCRSLLSARRLGESRLCRS